MEEILPCRSSISLDLGLEELEERLELMIVLPTEGEPLKPCIWACECYLIWQI